MNESREVDLVVVGLGPGGEALATGAAKAGLTVVAVDKHLVGGECPYYGCIPTKMMVRAADALAEARRADSLAGAVTVHPSWTPVADRVSNDATDDWDDRVAVERLEGAGATVLHGTARLAGERVVVDLADGTGGTLELLAARGVVLNPGTAPAEPPVPGLEGTPYWTNRDAVRTTSVPDSLVIIGGGPIGCELAQVFARFGADVTVVQHGGRLLPADEPEASAALREIFEHEGIRVLTDTEAGRVQYVDGRFSVELSEGEPLRAGQLLVAAGRRSNLEGIGLDSVGLDPSDLQVDERLRAKDGLWVLGDVTGHGAFTHVSMYQSAIALRDVLGEDGPPATYEAVPHTTFTDPEVAGVGLTEAAAREAGLSVRVGQADLGASSRGFTHGPGGAGLIKLVEDADRGVLVGGTVVGPAAGEILAMVTLAVHAAVPTSTLRTMIYAYPTFHRAIESALADLET
ncbi:NAD(P)/FAD-dependent oxidoreductase [Aeromicrobium sp. Marseille-Q0843]|uniref:NAD(P)/FAD-dependent oxidoreductase n=1 Tax=Aeromicrobium phoceense TaxID=2754045 RepID=A0A838XKI9_9ACTN|nr:NAD(P)/FAD-dependent oxidoreductase [Aeromicrobium phoceense]MBA4609136.1 NAD(P)/FAD-dependent oxidoreductase [Aeromicrobium phoceense]